MMKRGLSCFLYVSKSLLKMKATLKRKNLCEIQLGRFSSNQFVFSVISPAGNHCWINLL